LKIYRDSVLGIVQRHYPNLQGLYLFGSGASGQEQPESDIDLAILLPKATDPVLLWEGAQQTAVEVGKRVDIIDLRCASTVLKAQVVNSGQRIATIDQTACQEFEMLALSMYLRFNEERIGIIEAIQKDRRVWGAPHESDQKGVCLSYG
jgi:predicted nucleotidyltransferase